MSSCASKNPFNASPAPVPGLDIPQESPVISTSQIRGSPRWFRHHEIHVPPASMAPHVSIICPSFQVTNSAHDVNRIHRLSDPVPHRVAFVSMAMFLPFSTNGLENLKQTKNRLRRQRNNGVAIDLNQLQKQANPKDQIMKHTTQGVALTNLKEKMA